MNIIALDDNKKDLGLLVDIIKQVRPDNMVYSFSNYKKVLEFAKSNTVDIAFLDISMEEMNGIELAMKLKAINKNLNVIFVTTYAEYMAQAFQVRASGYLIKPVTKDQVIQEFENLRNPVDDKQQKIVVQTFGNFEVFYDGLPLKFGRAKSKELFAYLVDKRGASCTRQELLVALFEDEFDDSIYSDRYLSQVFFALMKAFKGIGAEDVIVKSRDAYAVDTTKFSCDYYDYLNGDPNAINKFRGEYMTNYDSWSGYSLQHFYKQNRDNF